MASNRLTVGIEADGTDRFVRDMGRLEDAVEQVEGEVGRLADELESTEGAMRDLADVGTRETKALSRDTGRSVSNIKRDLTSLDGELDQTGRAYRELTDDAKRAGDAADDAIKGGGGSVSGGGIDGLINKMSDIGPSAAGAVGALGAVTAALDLFGVTDLAGNFLGRFSGPLEFQGDEAAATARLGLDRGALLPNVELIGEEFGFDRDEIIQALVAVSENLDADATSGEAAKLAAQVLSLERTGVGDAVEVANAVGELSAQFGVDTDAAVNLLAAAVQSGGDRTGQLTDTISEYSQYATALGLGVEDFVSIVAAAAGPEFGQMGQDKIADALKELDVRVTDGGDDVTEALDSIGLGRSAVASAFARGGDAGRDALEDIIAGITDANAAEQKRLVTALFGSPGEDVGATDLLRLLDLDGVALEVTGALADDIAKQVTNTAADAVSRTGERVLNDLDQVVTGRHLLPSAVTPVAAPRGSGASFSPIQSALAAATLNITIEAPTLQADGLVTDGGAVQRFFQLYGDMVAQAAGPAIAVEVDRVLARHRVFSAGGATVHGGL